MLFLSLCLSVLEASLSTLPILVRSNQLQGKLLILLLGSGQGLAGLCVKVVCDSSLGLSNFHLLVGHKYLLDRLRNNDKGIPD